MFGGRAGDTEDGPMEGSRTCFSKWHPEGSKKVSPDTPSVSFERDEIQSPLKYIPPI